MPLQAVLSQAMIYRQYNGLDMIDLFIPLCLYRQCHGLDMVDLSPAFSFSGGHVLFKPSQASPGSSKKMIS